MEKHVNNLIYEHQRAQQHLVEARKCWEDAVSKASEAKEALVAQLMLIDNYEEAVVGDGRAYWLDENGMLCSFKLIDSIGLLVVGSPQDDGDVTARPGVPVPDAALVDLAEASVKFTVCHGNGDL